ncbi:MAG: class I SAM-dependent methyltransferase [Actinomycetia bacterium]|nr:class I SAM-dependent methyltransferase [Actinomycetes bacterium]
MTTTAGTPETEAPQIDEERLMSFVFKAVDELGATLNAALVVMGDRLGYYRAMADGQGVTPDELADRTRTDEHYAREWLNAQAAGEYVAYNAATGHYSLPPEQAFALADETSPVYLPGFFQIVHGTVRDAPAIIEHARTGTGLGWHEHNADVHVGCERFFRPQYNANLVSAWLPALDGVVDTLTAGGRVADVGCGHGASTVLMAQAFPQAVFNGFDYHDASITTARERARVAGVGDRIAFDQSDAQSLTGGPYDLVTMFDCLHDMGDPVGAARRVYDNLAPDGTWMVVEPIAGDHVQDNLNPVGRTYYAFSTLLCTPASLSQDVGRALGTQAGQARLTDVATEAGFSRVRRVAETPFNMVLEIRR